MRIENTWIAILLVLGGSVGLASILINFKFIEFLGSELVPIRETAALFTAIGVFIASFTFWANTRRSQQELAVKLIVDWSKDYDLKMKHAFYFAGQLTPKNIQIITSGTEPVILGVDEEEIKALSILKYLFDNKDTYITEDGTAKLTLDQCRIIDFYWMQILHKIESIILAWDSGAASDALMKKEFEPLILGYRGHLTKLLYGQSSFPFIQRRLKQISRRECRKAKLNAFLEFKSVKQLFHCEV
ncbi:hypothetical protein OLMES_1582 [Oleiphilus messinensis]|uniref:Uncharacterized protein n=1 Tax=Oleiphilus messinensis TaxID=141451 RepID=A0A1Y0I5A2_9GAMM|nr:hypothetical protein [Oleiphilus messinensis]ARU55657.1 hypothetical protein OLMES_1582 [Oleiphilus messinensis]